MVYVKLNQLQSRVCDARELYYSSSCTKGGKLEHCDAPYPLYISLSLLICSSCRLIISLLTTCSFFSVFSISKSGLSFVSSLFVPLMLVPYSISLTNIDWWRQVGVKRWIGAMEVSAPLTHCKRVQALIFCCIFNVFTSYIFFLLWIITAYMHGWLPGSNGKIKFLCAVMHNRIYSKAHLPDGPSITVYNHSPSSTGYKWCTYVLSFSSNAF